MTVSRLNKLVVISRNHSDSRQSNSVNQVLSKIWTKNNKWNRCKLYNSNCMRLKTHYTLLSIYWQFEAQFNAAQKWIVLL